MAKMRGEARHGGRRRSPEERRELVLTVRLAVAERQTIWRRAALARLPVAAYVRQTALRPAAPPRSVPIVNVRSYGQLGRLANNLNQLTRLVHEGRTSPALLPCLVALLAEVRRVRRLLVGLDREGGGGGPAAGGEDPGAEGTGAGGVLAAAEEVERDR